MTDGGLDYTFECIGNVKTMVFKSFFILYNGKSISDQFPLNHKDYSRTSTAASLSSCWSHQRNIFILPACCFGVSSPWLGGVSDHWRSSFWCWDLHKTIPAGDWKSLEGNCFWRWVQSPFGVWQGTGGLRRDFYQRAKYKFYFRFKCILPVPFSVLWRSVGSLIDLFYWPIKKLPFI
jgi:hypothetical protein